MLPDCFLSTCLHDSKDMFLAGNELSHKGVGGSYLILKMGAPLFLAMVLCVYIIQVKKKLVVADLSISKVGK